MIKSLKDARSVDGLPRILAKQPWVRALSDAMGVVHEMTMAFADHSQIYTDIDNVTEDVLDELAVNWKIDWYDTGYNIEQKRRIIKTALTVRRTMGTVAAVKAQADAIYPGTTLEEWFEWGGEPGTFRLHVDISQTDAQHPIIFFTNEEIERRLATAKRFSTQLESMSYQVAHGIEVDAAVEGWTASPPICGTIVCGVHPNIKTLGHAIEKAIHSGGGDVVTAYAGTPPVSGAIRCGEKP